MPSDIAIGVLAALMALLGAIVSIHAPTDKNWKIGYVITFVVLAAASTYFVVQQSTENADTNKHAAVALAKLGAASATIEKSSEEAVRLQKDNSALQTELLKQSAAIRSLSKENLAEATGGNTICHVVPDPTSRDTKGLYSLTLFVSGHHPMRNVSMFIVPESFSGDSWETTKQKSAAQQVVTLD